jgi:hypothetical protein
VSAPLPDLVARIVARQQGRSEATLAVDIRALLWDYLDQDSDDVRDVSLEAAAGGGGRIDIEVGFTVIEVKRSDSPRWGRIGNLLTHGKLTIETDDEASLFNQELRFPERLLAGVAQFDRLVKELARRAHDRPKNRPAPNIVATFRRIASLQPSLP